MPVVGVPNVVVRKVVHVSLELTPDHVDVGDKQVIFFLVLAFNREEEKCAGAVLFQVLTVAPAELHDLRLRETERAYVAPE